MTRAAVFLDRDGVLNRTWIGPDGKPRPPQDFNELGVLSGVKEACMLMKRAGFVLIGVTNQPDVARGTQDRGMVSAINSRIRESVPLDDLLVCWHDDADGCGCRKPQPGLLVEGGRRFGVDLRRSIMIGDRWSDVEAGRRAGCRTILVGDGYGERALAAPDHLAADLLAAARWIVGEAA